MDAKAKVTRLDDNGFTVGESAIAAKGPVGAEVSQLSRHEGEQIMVCVGRATGKPELMTGIDVFAHYTLDGQLTTVRVWNGRDWVSVEVEPEVV